MASALLIAPTPEQIAHYQHFTCTIWGPEHDVRPPWQFTETFDFILSNIWPQEEAARTEYLARLRRLLARDGLLYIARCGFEKAYCQRELPVIEPKNNWLLTSTLWAELPPPCRLKLEITNLQDPYPLKARFLVALLDSLRQKSGAEFSYTMGENEGEIELQATGTATLQMALHPEKRTFRASLEPADNRLFEILSKLAVATFTNDIKEFNTEKSIEVWTTHLTASA